MGTSLGYCVSFSAIGNPSALKIWAGIASAHGALPEEMLKRFFVSLAVGNLSSRTLHSIFCNLLIATQ